MKVLRRHVSTQTGGEQPATIFIDSLSKSGPLANLRLRVRMERALDSPSSQQTAPTVTLEYVSHARKLNMRPIALAMGRASIPTCPRPGEGCELLRLGEAAASSTTC
jgi:hypothetical protein